MGTKKIGTKIHFLGRNAFVLLVTFMFLCFGSVAYAEIPVANADNCTVDEDNTLNGDVLIDNGHGADNLGDGLVAVNLFSNVSHGSLTLNAAGTFSYTPDTNYYGPDSFTYTITDLDPEPNTSNVATVSITVNPENDAPTANDDSDSTVEDTPVIIDVVTNDTDVEGTIDPTTVTIVGVASNGGTNINPTTGEVTYTPDPDYNGSDSFTYTVDDNEGATSNVATVSITVNPENDAPTANDDSDSTVEDTPVIIDVVTNDTDVEGTIDPTTVTIVGVASNGGTNVNPTTGEVTYTPDPDYNGSDSFTYTVDDNEGATSNVATVSITVNPENDAPTANDDSDSTVEDTPVIIDVVTNDTDVEGTIDPTTVTIVGVASNGGTNVNPTTGEVTYTPDPDYNGSDSFTYTVDDNEGATSNVATVSITVNPENDAPTANDDSDSTVEDTPVIIDVVTNDTDVEGTIDPTTVTIVGVASNGGTNINPTTGEVTYTPDPDYNGSDSFTYTVDDNEGATSNVATVSITVNPENDAPTANDDSDSTVEDTPVIIDVVTNDTDVEGTIDPTTVTIVGVASNGGTNINPTTGEVTYTPDPDYNGSDSFTYTVDDNEGATSNVATVSITVNPENDAPTANDDSDSTVEDTPVIIDVVTNDTDVEGTIDPTTVTIVGVASNGGTNVNPTTGEVTYTPDPDYNGSDSFTYTVDDNEGATSNVATVSITVNPENDAPTANDDSDSTVEDTPVIIDVVTNDTDVEGTIDPTTVTIVGVASNGGTNVNPTTGEVTYTPDPDYNGSDSFTYTVDDNEGATSNVATVSITVNPENDAPTANDDSDSTVEDTPVIIDVVTNDTDVEGTIDPTTVTIVGVASNGGTNINPTTGEVTYTPDPDYNGSDSFTYTVDDNEGATSNVATVSITVNPENDAPTANDDSDSTVEDTPVIIDVVTNDTDVEGTIDPTTVTIVGVASNGGTNINPTTGEVTYTPDPDYNGSDSFTYTVDDNEGATSNVATVSITVNPENDAPTANDDSDSTVEDTPVIIDVVTNDTDVEGTIDPTTVTIVGVASNGGTNINPTTGEVTYTPDPDYNGSDSFTYTVDDNEGATSNVATVSITVTSANDPPTAINDLFTALEDSTDNTIYVLNNDTDPDTGDTLTITLVDTPNHGGTATTDGNTVTYTPLSDFNGQETFDYTIQDAAGEPSTATVTVNVVETNETPVARNDYFTMYEDTVSDPSWNVTAANPQDPDELGDEPSTIHYVSDPNNGTLVLNLDGTFTYTPNSDWRGNDSFTYNITDYDGEVSNTATVYITVLNTNDTPVTQDDNFGMDEDSGTLEGDVLADNDNGADELGDTPSTVNLVENVIDGALALDADGTFTYTPVLDFNGEDTFTYNITDQDEISNTATVTITVSAVNDAPVALADSYNTGEDTTLNVNEQNGVLNNDTDVDSSSFTAVLNDNVGHGTLTLDPNGSFEYTPATNFSGTDVFTYHAFDEFLSSNIVTVTIAVSNVNDPPVAMADSYDTDEETLLTVDAEHGVLSNDTDADDDDLTAALDTTTTNGLLSLAGDGSFFYAPYDNFNGIDTFTYHAFDGEYPSSTVTVTITVENVNDVPVANTDSVTVDEDSIDSFFDVLANDTDADYPVPGDTKTITVIGEPDSGGTAVIDGNQIRYSPAGDFNGAETFTYTMEDGEGASSSAMVNVTVINFNDAPVAQDDDYIVDEDSSDHFFDVLANDTDVDDPNPGDTKTITLVGTPDSGGTAIIEGGQIKYSPATDFNGTEIFTYTMEDGEGVSDIATVTVTVDNLNDPPLAYGDPYTVDEDSGDHFFDVLANDTDADIPVPGDTKTITLVDTPDNGGTAVIDGNQIRYSPATDFNGTETFTYTMKDGQGVSDAATVTVTVDNINDDPVANNDEYTVDEDSSDNPFDVLVNDTDADDPGDTMTITGVGTPDSGGTAVKDGDQIKYSPAGDFNGTETFTYTIQDSQGASDDATVTVTVTNINDAPIAQDDLVTTDEETAIQVMVMENDYLGDLPTTVTNVWPAGNGTVSFDATSTTYTPDVDFVGTDVYNYQITDGDGSTDIGTVIVTVEPVDPIAADDGAQTDEGTPVVVAVLDNDFLGLNEPTIITAVTQGANGTVTFTDTSTTYTPIGDFNGTDSYTYTITDNNGESSTATVTVTVQNVNDAPVAVDDSFTVDKDSSGNALDVLANDTDADLPDDTLTITEVTPAGNGTVSINGSSDGLLYTPASGYVGSDSFNYTIEDAAHESSAASVAITVNPLVFSPEFTSMPGTEATVDLQYVYRITAEDGDSDTLTITGTIPGWLTLIDNGDGTGYLFGVPGVADVVGDNSVELVVTDDEANFDTQSFTITVSEELGLIPQGGWTLYYVDSQELSWGDSFLATNAFDGRADTIWHTEWENTDPLCPHEIQINLGGTYNIGGLRYLSRQDSQNGRINDFEFYVSQTEPTGPDYDWGDPVITGTFLNSPAEQELIFPSVQGQYVRLVAVNEVRSNPWTAMAELNLLYAPNSGEENRAPNGTIDLPLETEVTIARGESVEFAGSGTDAEPENDIPFSYEWDFDNDGMVDSIAKDPGYITFDTPGTFTVSLRVIDAMGASDLTPATCIIHVSTDADWIPHDAWSLWYVDSEELVGEEGQPAVNAFDGLLDTIWHTEWDLASPGLPHEIQINLGGIYEIDGFRCVPRQDGGLNGMIEDFQFYVSTNGIEWTSVATGTFPISTEPQEVMCPRTTGQFVRLVALSEPNNKPWTCVAEIDVLGVNVGSENHRPVGIIDLPTEQNLTIYQHDYIYFAGHGTDPDGDPITYLWNFENSGIPDYDGDVPGLVQFNTPGTFTVTLTVTDDSGFPDLQPPTRTVEVRENSTIISRDNWSVWFVDSEETSPDYPAPASNVYDGDSDTYWHTEWVGHDPLNLPGPPHEIQIDLGANCEIEGFEYLPRQDSEIARINDFEFYVSQTEPTGPDYDWGDPVVTGTFPEGSASWKRWFTPTTARFIRLRVINSHMDDPCTAVAELNVYGTELAPDNHAPNGTISLPGSPDVAIDVGGSVEFSGYGEDEDDDTLSYEWDFNNDGEVDSTVPVPGDITFDIPGTFTVTFTVVDEHGSPDPTPDSRIVNVTSNATPIPMEDWVVTVDSEASGYEGANAIDGDSVTFWHTPWSPTDLPHPHWIEIYLGDVYEIEALRYLPRQGENGRIKGYEFYVSLDGSDWDVLEAVAEGEFENSDQEQEVAFVRTRGQYVRLVALSEVNNEAWTSVGELNIIGSAVQSLLDITPEFSTVTVEGTVQFTASEGFEPYTFEIVDNRSGGQINANGLYTAGLTAGVTDTIRVTDFAYAYKEAFVTVACPVDITPKFSHRAVNGTVNFWATDGVPPFSFSFVEDGNNSGGTIDATSGLYKAGANSGVTDTVQVEDDAGTTATATINIVDMPVAITPTGVTLPSGAVMYFAASGGEPGYVFDMADGQSQGSIDPNTGLYTAGPISMVRDVVRVTDNNGTGNSAQTPVDVVEQMSALDQSGWTLHYVDSEELSVDGPPSPATYAFDGDSDSFWHTDYRSTSPDYPHEIQINLGAIYEISGFRYLPRETLRRSRAGMYEFYVSKDGSTWDEPVASGFFPYYDASDQQILFPQVTGQYVRFVLLRPLVTGQEWAAIAELDVLGAPFSFNYKPDVMIDTPGNNLTINTEQTVDFTATATDPDGSDQLTYLWDFKDPAVTGVDLDVEDPGLVTFHTPGTYVVTLTVTDDLGGSTTATRVIKVLNGGSGLIPRNTWEVAWTDSEETSYAGLLTPAVNVLDGDSDTIWHTEWYASESATPHELIIDLGSAYMVDGLRYLPRQDMVNGRIEAYHVYVCADGKNWGNAVATGTFANTTSEIVLLFAPKWGRFVRLVALTEVNGNPWTAVAELNVEGMCEDPYVRLVYPLTGEIQQGPDLKVRASVCLNSSMFGALGVNALGVKFRVDGVYEHVVWLPASDIINVDTFDYTFLDIGWGDHIVEALIVDESENPIAGDTMYDVANSVTLGEYIVAAGDSITWGHVDDLDTDHFSQDGRNVGYGYPILLNDLLTAHRGRPHTVLNEGVLGERTSEGLYRLREMMFRNPHAGYYLTGYGANDTIDGSSPLPSGLGLSPGDAGYSGSYKDLSSQMLDMLAQAGQKGYFSEVIYSKSLTRNPSYQEYNGVLHGLTAEREIPVAPPGIYAYFEQNTHLYADSIHPNGEGYQHMATLWFDALTKPTAKDDTATTNAETTVNINVVTNDTDPDGTIDVSTVEVVSAPDPANGSVVINPDGTVDYTPAPGFSGPDSFIYTVKDDRGNTSNEATVNITVE